MNKKAGEAAKQRFDNWASEYEESRFQQFLVRPSHDLVIGSLDLEPDSRVLDVGCGTGLMARRIASTFDCVGVVGIDASKKMIDEARLRSEGTENLEFEVAYATDIPFPDESFDRVVCCHSFHMHLDQEASLKEMCRVLKEGASLLIIDIARFGVAGRAVCYFHEVFPLGEGKIRTHSVRELETLMEKVGLRPCLKRTITIWRGFPSVLVGGQKTLTA